MQKTRKFPGNYKSLAKIGHFLEQAIKDMGFNAKDTYSIKLAVEEACCNIIDHAYGGEGKGEIECSLKTEIDCLQFELRDFGKPFDPEHVPPLQLNKPLDDLDGHGAGFYLMNQLMDNVYYENIPGKGNLMILTKRKME